MHAQDIRFTLGEPRFERAQFGFALGELGVPLERGCRFACGGQPRVVELALSQTKLFLARGKACCERSQLGLALDGLGIARFVVSLALRLRVLLHLCDRALALLQVGLQRRESFAFAGELLVGSHRFGRSRRELVARA